MRSLVILVVIISQFIKNTVADRINYGIGMVDERERFLRSKNEMR